MECFGRFLLGCVRLLLHNIHEIIVADIAAVEVRLLEIWIQINILKIDSGAVDLNGAAQGIGIGLPAAVGGAHV